MAKIFESIIGPSQHGMLVACADKVVHCIYPFIQDASLDMEEMWADSWQQNPNLHILPRYNFSLTQEVKSDLPCPICPVPKGLLYAINLCYKPWEFSQAKDVILSALQMENSKLGDQMCQSEGFHKVKVSHIVNWVYGDDSYWFMQNFTWCISHSYMQNMLSYDKLHMFDSGIWGGHAWLLIQGAVLCLIQEKQKHLKEGGKI